MIVAPLLVLVAGTLAGLAIGQAGHAHLSERVVPGIRRSPSRFRPPSIPDLAWRWWPAICAIAGWALGGVIVAVLGAIGARVGTVAIRRRRKAKVAAQLDEQLADAVRSLAAGMRAGLSVPQALAYAAREGEPPLADTLARVVDHVELGGGLEEALASWAGEIDTDDAKLVVGVLALHRRSGGDLPRVLDQVATTLRERTSAAREIRALTAQARLSGAILGLLPIGFFGFLWMTSRGDIQGAFDSPIGMAAVVAGLVLEGVAFVWIRSLLEVA